MSITKLDLEQWFETGIELKATYMIVVCDSFDYEDYPAYVLPGDNVHERINHYRLASMQRIMAVYDLSMDKTTQLNEGRAFNHPPFPDPDNDSD